MADRLSDRVAWGVFYVQDNGDRLLTSLHATEESANKLASTLEGDHEITAWSVHP